MPRRKAAQFQQQRKNRQDEVKATHFQSARPSSLLFRWSGRPGCAQGPARQPILQRVHIDIRQSRKEFLKGWTDHFQPFSAACAGQVGSEKVSSDRRVSEALKPPTAVFVRGIMDTSAAKQGLFSFLQLPGSGSDSVNCAFHITSILAVGILIGLDCIRTKVVFQFQPFKGIAQGLCPAALLTAAQMTA